MSCFLFAIKTLNSSFAEVDSLELETLAELISVYDKINGDAKKTTAYIDDVL